MMAVHPRPDGAWWKQLSDHLHHRTENRLRRLQIRAVGGRVSIQAIAPCDRVRDQAEEAAREVVPDEMLALRIKIAAGGDAPPPSKTDPDRPARAAPQLFANRAIHRRMSRLVNGN